MKNVLLSLLSLTSVTAFAQAKVTAPTPYGHVWSTYTQDNLGLDEAVVGLSEDFDGKLSGDVSLATNGKETSIHTASLTVQDLLTKSDHLTVGLQAQPYVGLMEKTLGTRWLYPTFAQAAGLLPAKDAGAAYSLGVGPASVTVHARNDAPNDKHQTYGAMVDASPASWLQIVLAGEHNSLTKDRLVNAAVVLKGYSAVYAVEAAQQKPGESDGDEKTLTSYGATLTYGLSPQLGLYAQYVTGDDNYKAAHKYEDKALVGPTYKYSDHLNTALLYHAVDTKDEAGEAKRDETVELRGALTF